MKKTLLSWSTGKDSAWMLHVLRKNPDYELAGLFTTTNEAYDRVAMHSTRSELLRLQAENLGLPLQVIELPDQCSNEKYKEIMGRFVDGAVADGVQCMAFGDLYLEDIRDYRIKQLAGTGIEPIFPVWGIPTDQLANTMLDAGVKAYVSCVDLKKLPSSVAGRLWSKELLAELPEGADPCCENGEMHTIAVGGPMFSREIPVKVGEVVERGGFAFADIIPV